MLLIADSLLFNRKIDLMKSRVRSVHSESRLQV